MVKENLKRMELRLPAKLKADFEVCATAMGRNSSSLIREFMESYISACQEAEWDKITAMQISWEVAE